MNIEEIKKKLIEGNKRFVADKLDGKLQDSNRRNELTGGQQPHTVVLSCSDSRVVPELIFDAGLGELFVVRVAGNVANTSSIASIEYAVQHCYSKAIVVLGHQSCGAVTAAVNGGDNGYNLNLLLSHVTPAIHACGNNASINEIVKKNAQLTANELINRSPIVAKSINAKSIEIIPAYYYLDTGKVIFL